MNGEWIFIAMQCVHGGQEASAVIPQPLATLVFEAESLTGLEFTNEDGWPSNPSNLRDSASTGLRIMYHKTPLISPPVLGIKFKSSSLQDNHFSD